MDQEDKVSRKRKVLKMLHELSDKREALSLKLLVMENDFKEAKDHLGQLNLDIEKITKTVSLMG